MIKHIKLIGGDEIIGDVQSEDNTSDLIVFNPLQVFFEETERNKFMIYMTEYLLYTTGNNVTIPLRSIVHSGTVTEEVLDYYFVSLEYVRTTINPAIKDTLVKSSIFLTGKMESNGHTESKGIPLSPTRH
jgi:hypothetical protein